VDFCIHFFKNKSGIVLRGIVGPCVEPACNADVRNLRSGEPGERPWAYAIAMGGLYGNLARVARRELRQMRIHGAPQTG
jgi:hypothetical protein